MILPDIAVQIVGERTCMYRAKNDQVNVVLLDQFQDLGLLLLFRGCGDGEVMEGILYEAAKGSKSG